MSISDAIVERLEAEVECLRDEVGKQTERADTLEAALTDLVGQVEMAESEGICLPNRVAVLNALQALTA